MGQQPLQKGDPAIPLPHQRVPKLMRHRERAQGSHRVHKQRMRPVEGINVAIPLLSITPPGRLDSPGDLQRQLQKIVLLLVWRDPPLPHQPPQVAIGGDVVEPMVMHSHVGNVRGHHPAGAPPADLQKLRIPGRVILEQGRSILEPLRPFGPSPGCVFTLDSENR